MTCDKCAWKAIAIGKQMGSTTIKGDMLDFESNLKDSTFLSPISEHYKDSPDDEVLEYIVTNENTLGYLFKKDGFFHVGVLSGSTIKGGSHEFAGTRVVSDEDFVRTATKRDFDSYRVESKGYIPETII